MPSSVTLQRNLDSLAREHTEDAIATIVAIMNDPDMSAKERLAAAREVLDRGHGKPLAATISIPASKAMQAKLLALTDEELTQALRQHELPRLFPREHVADVSEDAEIDYSDDPLLK